MYDSDKDERSTRKEKVKQKLKKGQSKSDYDDSDDEDGDLESAAVAQRLIQSCSPGFFQAVVVGNVFFCDLVATFVCVLVVSGAAAQ